MAGGRDGVLVDREIMMDVVNFTDLGLSPIAFQIGGFALRWYALAYVVGTILGWMYLYRMVRRDGSPLPREKVDDLVLWTILGVILGGRIGYVLFYSPAQYLADPLSVFALNKGGMAFHGGVAGVAIALILFARAKKLNWLRLCDYIVCVYPIGHFLGRIANFVNGELWGRPTNGGWGIIFPEAGPEPRHPSQLYEAGLEGLLLFALLWWMFWRTDARLYPGRLVGAFALFMGGTRFAVEFFREPDRGLGILSTGLTMGQTLTVPLLAIGAYLLLTSKRRMVVQEAS